MAICMLAFCAEPEMATQAPALLATLFVAVKVTVGVFGEYV